MSTQDQLDHECKTIEMLAEVSEGDAQEVIQVAVEYAPPALLAKIVRGVLLCKSDYQDLRDLVNVGVLKVAELNIERNAA